MSDRIPTYRKHKASGQAVVTLPDGLRGRKDILLGKYGTVESRREYARVIGEWEAAGRRLPRTTHADITINELILSFWPHAQQHYRHADGTPTGEQKDWKLSLRPLREWYGTKPAKDFGPLCLKALREKLVNQPIVRRIKFTDSETGKGKWQEKVIRVGLARGVVNQRIGRIKRLFRWGVENELVPASVWHALKAVSGLERGRSAARETEPVEPIALQWVKATLPHLTPTVADMVQLQLLTGARSGEICTVRACDIDMQGKVWLYRPTIHKTAHLNKKRIIAIGPRGQEIICRRLKPNLQAYLFSPAESVAEKRERDRQRRKTKLFPCEKKRVEGKFRRKPKCIAGEQYSAATYAIAVRRAIEKANRERKGIQPIPHWHPQQLRHTKATEIRRAAGLDAARAVLGHTSPVVTEVYAELDIATATEVMARIG
ncbi:MAG: site-specific integrase [Gemmataceae bacterium]|nr:site-specific integrase [Gemmataceae bacterium]